MTETGMRHLAQGYARACFDVFSEGYLRQIDLDPAVYNCIRSTSNKHFVGCRIPSSTPGVVLGSDAGAAAAGGASSPFGHLLSPSDSSTQASFLGSGFCVRNPNRHVQELDLSGCSRLGSENFPLVALCCPNLQVLRLIGCCQVSSTSLALTVSHLPQLQYLNLDFCAQTDDNLLHALAEHCPLLTRLQLCGCVRVTSAGLAGSADGRRMGLAQGCVKLRRLLLRGCVLVDDVGVLALAEHSTALGELCLTACPNIRPPTIARLILCCRRLSVFKVELYFPSEGGQGGEDRGQRIRLIDGVPNAVATLQSLLPPEDPTMRALIAAAGTGRVSGRRHRL